jgi:hypothetical protein
MTICYFCHESFTIVDKYENMCPECRNSLRQFMDKNKPKKWTAESFHEIFGLALRDFTNDLPKRFVKKRTLK